MFMKNSNRDCDMRPIGNRSLFKPFILLFALFSITSWANLSAQNIDNPSFETWDNVGQNSEEPVEWNGTKTGGGLAGLGPKTCWREATTVHSGTYSAKVQTVGSPFGDVNGSVTCGKIQAPTATPADGYSETQTGGENFALAARPDSFVVWVNYTSVGGDQARAQAVLHENYAQRTPFTNDPNGSTNVIANAELNFGSTGGWIRLSLPFDYATYNNADPAAFLLVTFTSSAIPGGGTAGSVLYIDDIELIYNPPAPTLATDSVATGPHYVSATQGAALQVDYTVTGAFNGPNTFTAELSDAAGSFAAPVSIGTMAGTGSGSISATIPAGTVSGTAYRVRVVADDPVEIGSDNGTDIEIVLVANAIAPTATQNILVGMDGTDLIVTENDFTASREWKYTTTPGGPYLSFAPTQTDTFYTPNFAIQGTYYVICESNIQALTAVSNEVEIVVSPLLGISEGLAAKGRVYSYGNHLMVDLKDIALDSPELKAFDLSGRLIYSGSLENGVFNVLSLDYQGVLVVQLGDGEFISPTKVLMW